MHTTTAQYLSLGYTNLAFDLLSAIGCVLGPEMEFVSMVNTLVELELVYNENNTIKRSFWFFFLICLP